MTSINPGCLPTHGDLVSQRESDMEAWAGWGVDCSAAAQGSLCWVCFLVTGGDWAVADDSIGRLSAFIVPRHLYVCVQNSPIL